MPSRMHTNIDSTKHRNRLLRPTDTIRSDSLTPNPVMEMSVMTSCAPPSKPAISTMPAAPPMAELYIMEPACLTIALGERALIAVVKVHTTIASMPE